MSNAPPKFIIRKEASFRVTKETDVVDMDWISVMVITRLFAHENWIDI